VTPGPTLEQVTAQPVDWRKNLAALWIGVFLAVAGMSFTSPFLPLFLNRELGVTSNREVAIWTGVAQAALGAGLLIASPIWGLVADRYGRKLMLLRAMFFGAFAVGLVGFARTPLDVTLLRFLYGAAAGTYPVAIAIVAMETPRRHVGWAVGVLSSAVAVATAVGPAIGGLGAATLGLRGVFIVSGGMFLVAGVPIFLLVRERPPAHRAASDRSRSTVYRLRATPKSAVRAIAGLLVAQTLAAMASNAVIILIVLKLLALTPPHITAVTGFTFAASGVATAIAGLGYSQLARRLGYGRTVAVVAVGLGGVTLGMASAQTIAVLIGLAVLFGLVNGIATPAIAALLGMESPDDIKGTVFGFLSSAGAVGMLLGPLLAGFTAASLTPSGGFIVVAGLAATLAVVGVIWLREPPPEGTTSPA
jgi:MFS transporter, DHA1 family, multidrug resistance protein